MSTKHVIDPSALEDPGFDPDAYPGWANIHHVMREAAAAGEVVELRTRLDTITPAEAAERLGMSRSTISRRISSGEIATVKVGNRHRITEQEFRRFHGALMADMITATSDEFEADLYGGD